MKTVNLVIPLILPDDIGDDNEEEYIRNILVKMSTNRPPKYSVENAEIRWAQESWKDDYTKITAFVTLQLGKWEYLGE